MAQIRLSIPPSSISPLTTANWSLVPGSTFNGMRSGSIGSSAMLHFAQRGSVSPGSHSETRWPMAQVTTYCSPTRQPSPRAFTPSTRAMSLATEGFSATISFLDIWLLLYGMMVWAVSNATTGRAGGRDIICYLPYFSTL